MVNQFENQAFRHDVIAFTTQLAEQIGPASRFVHIGLTSSDVVDTAWALRLKHAAKIISEDLKRITVVLRRLAKKHAHTIMMGRTHGMHAEPTTFGLKCLVWLQEFERHRERFDAATKRVCVGKISGAVGTFAHSGPNMEKYVCKSLGLGFEPVSTQVVQRDRHSEFLSVLALITASIEKIAQEVRHLQRPEFRELEEPFASGQKGSSAMPHKRNPVVCEQLCGLARVVRANASAGLENVALWHERDISHSSVERVVIPDSCSLTDYMLGKLQWLLEGMKVDKKRMRENLWLTRGLIFSQKVLLHLIEVSPISREDAYTSVQAAAMRTWNGGEDFATELLKETPVRKHLDRDELAEIMNPESFLQHIGEHYKRCGIPIKAAPRKAL